MSQIRTETLPYTTLQRDAAKTEKRPQWCKCSYPKVLFNFYTIYQKSFFEGAKLALKNSFGKTPLDLIFNNVQDPGSFLENFFIKNTVNEVAQDVADTRSFCFKYDILNPKSGRKRGAGKVKSNENLNYKFWFNICSGIK